MLSVSESSCCLTSSLPQSWRLYTVTFDPSRQSKKMFINFSSLWFDLLRNELECMRFNSRCSVHLINNRIRKIGGNCYHSSISFARSILSKRVFATNLNYKNLLNLEMHNFCTNNVMSSEKKSVTIVMSNKHRSVFLND